VRKQAAPSAHYPIRAVSKLTGIAIDTLRAWERRHGAVTPVRDDRGRMYTDADIVRLRLLKDAVEHGHSIGRLAGLGDEELRHLADTTRAPAAPAAALMRQTPLDTSAAATAKSGVRHANPARRARDAGKLIGDTSAVGGIDTNGAVGRHNC